MADNVLVDNGSLTDYTVATDEVAVGGTQPTAQVQFVKLVDGALNGTTPIGGDAANGLDVDVTRVGGTVTVSGTVAVSGQVDTELPVAATLGDNASNPTAPAVGAHVLVWDGATWDRLRGDSTGGVFAQGPAAADAAVVGNPVLVGARASTAVPTAVSGDGDAVAVWATRLGSLNVVLRDSAGAELSVGGGTQYDEDTASVAAEKVTMAGVVRKDSAGSLVDTDGDRTELQVDSTGALRVTSGGGGGGPTHVDKAAFTPSSDDGVPVFGMFDDASPSTLLEGEAGVLRATANRALHVNLRDGSGLAIASTGGADNILNTTNALAVAGFGYVHDGSNWDRLRGDSVGGAFHQGPAAADAPAAGNPLYVGGRASAAAPADVSLDGDVVPAWRLRNGAEAVVVTAAGALIGGDAAQGLDVDVTRVSGTVTVDSELPAAVALGDNTTNPTVPAVGSFPHVWDGATWDRLPGNSAGGMFAQGPAAHDAAAVGNPVLNGGQMETMADSAPGTRAGTDGDVVKLALLDGAIYQAGRGPQSFQFHDNEAAGSLNTDTSVHAAPGAGLSLYVTDIVFSIGAATASSIFLEEGVTTVIGPFYLEAVAGRGMAVHFQTPKKITANTALTVTNTGSTTFSIEILGFIAPG